MNQNLNQLEISISELADQDLICLRTTTIVEPTHPLFNLYQKSEASSSINKAQISVLNSILHQRRRFFILTRKNLSELLKSDKNWKTPVGLRNKHYSALIKSLTIKNIEVRRKGAGRSASIYAVIDPALLRALNLSDAEVENQKLQMRAFLEKEGSKSKNKPVSSDAYC